MSLIKLDDDTYLKELELNSANNLFNLINSNRDYLRTWLAWVEDTKHLDDTINYIQSVLNRDMFSGRFVLEIKHKDNLAGVIDLHNGDKIKNMAVEIGYWLGEQYQGKGIMTKACKCCIDYAFLDLEFNRIVIKCAAGNEKSKGIPKRLNFTFEGIEREGQNLNGKYTDLMVYSMLKREWLNPISSISH